MYYLNSFIVAGTICLIGQLILEYTLLTPGHVTSGFVVLGALLDTFGLYDKLIDWAGGGAMVPITSFGHSLIHGAMAEAEKEGILGIAMGMFNMTAAGITSAILFAFLVALVFKPKG